MSTYSWIHDIVLSWPDINVLNLMLVRTFIEEKAPAGSNFWSLFEMFSVHKILIFVLTFSQSFLLILDVGPTECVAIYILRE